MLTITLFRRFTVALNDAPLTNFPTDATRALLAYLAVHAGRPQARLALATLFWPDLPQSMGLQNIRTTLYRLRRVLGDKDRDIPFILTDRRSIQFNPDSGYTLDTARFNALYQEIQRNKTWLPLKRRQQMETAVSLSHPHFIPELAVDSTDFEAWRSEQEQRGQRRVFWLLDQLAQTANSLNDFQAMSRYAQQQTELAPLDEVGHENQMRALLGLGQRQEAAAYYEAYRARLTEQLGIYPTPALTALYWQIQPTDTPLTLDNPYRGLTPFHEKDASDFYGRETVVAQLKEALVELPLVALIGPSGSGKTSVACAGACAQLRREGWHILRLRPGANPWHSLSEAISNQMAVSPAIPPDALADGRYPLAQLKQAIRANHKGKRPFHLLVVIDQFEQLYTLLPDETARHAFIDWLLAASEETAVARTDVHLLLTMRADFMDQALAYRPLADALQPSILPIGPMTRSELRRAIIYPATSRRVAFQDGLVKRILDDVAAAPGQLPLLEFTLTRLWEEREEKWLTHRAYETNGGVGSALSFHAQTVYDQLNEVEQQLARRIFLHLVRSRQGVADTSRPTTRANLPKAAWALVQHLADARLIVTGYDGSGQEFAALAHEALISNWPLLRDWLNEDHAFHIWRQRLDTARHQWQENNQDAEALLRGRLLSEAEGWLTVRPADLSRSATTYIQASLQARDARQKAIESQRQQELAQAQALAEAEGQRATVAAQARQRLRWFAAGLTVMLLIAVLAMAAAVQQRQEAQRAAVVAQSSNLTTNAQLALNEGNTDLALTLAVEANRLPDPPFQAQRMLAEAAYAPGASRLFLGHDGPVADVAVAPGDWARALSASADGTLILWNLQTGASIRRFSGHNDAVHGVAFLP